MEALKTGSKAYFDTFAGLIPCKVQSISGPSGIASSEQNTTFKLTANRGAYKRGETLTAWSLHVIPRRAVRRLNGQARIHAYTVETEVR